MKKETEHRDQPRASKKGELVGKYREIGIPAVAAATKYQRPDLTPQRPRHMQAKNSSANGDASLKAVRSK